MLDNSTIDGLEQILVEGLEKEASDVHIEPLDKKIRIRFRIDGVLIEVRSLPLNTLGQLISRVKVLSNLDIAEKRLPQDGRFTTFFLGKEVDFRVSTINTIHGEKAVIRILDKKNKKFTLEEMGFRKEGLKIIKEELKKKQGLIFVTGPTGSGKSTTLYTLLNLLNSNESNLVTIEDPVEYNIEGVNQIQCRKEINLDFNTILPSILRQDPDIIMVGEVRDEKTASIVVRAALTGHLVLSTLHTNDAKSSKGRLLDMGVKNFLLTSTLNLVIAQRLVRRLCRKCLGKGCKYCDYTGFKGRIVIYEIMKGGKIYGSLLESGLELVKENITTIEEVRRIVYQ